jgi:hypothetical protein
MRLVDGGEEGGLARRAQPAMLVEQRKDRTLRAVEQIDARGVVGHVDGS